VPQAELATRLAELPRDRPILTVCAGGYRSMRAAQFLKQAGFADVRSVRGGTDAWREAGRELAVGDTSLEKVNVVESEWPHAGASTFASALTI
jgi:rhodanese-related sulfurtransferase